MDQVKFDKDYTYTVKLKDGHEVSKISGEQAQVKKDQLLVETKTEKKSLLVQDIKQINGVHNQSDGTNALKGLGVGAAVVGIPMGLLVGAFAGAGGTADCNGHCDGSFGLGFLAGAAMGGGIGGLIGLGIGALIPKHNRVQITPIIEPTSNGVNAGAKMQVNF
jgi:hypothetical protein